MNPTTQKVTVIDTKPSDKSLFNAAVGGHKFTITLKGYQSLVLNNKSRYKLAEGQSVEIPADEVIDLRQGKVPAGLKEENKNATTSMSVKDAAKFLETLGTKAELNEAIEGEIRKTVLEAYNRQLKKTTE